MYGQRPSSGWSPPSHYPRQERGQEPWTLEEEEEEEEEAAPRRPPAAKVETVAMPHAGAAVAEMMGSCEGPPGAPEVCTACQMPTPSPDPPARDEGAPNVDQEMQWVSTRMDSPLHAPPLSIQQFPAPAQAQSPGPYPFGSPSLGLCEEFPSEEMPTVPAEPSCEEMCVRESAEGPCAGKCCGLPYEPQRENPCKMPERPFYGSPYGEPWPGKARLPSIVVEPSEREEVESGELRWPPENFLFLDEEEQNELFDREEESLETGLSSFDSDVEEVLL